MSYQQIEDEYNRTQRRLIELEQKKKEIEKTPEFKDDKIRELEKRIVLLEKELQPYREAAKKCTHQIGCYCRNCSDFNLYINRTIKKNDCLNKIKNLK